MLGIRHSVYRFKSEYLFYSLADEAGFTISIIKNKKDQKTPDLLLNTIPIEVKTIIDKMEYQEKIENSILEEILASFKRNKIFKKINEGLSQGGKIIILDATAISLGYIVSYYASTRRVTLGIQKAIKDSIDFASAISSDFLISAVLLITGSLELSSGSCCFFS